MKKLIFVCTGNTCRSPMAEGLLKAVLPDDCGWEISSTGVCAADGWLASANAIEAVCNGGEQKVPLLKRMIPGLDG